MCDSNYYTDEQSDKIPIKAVIDNIEKEVANMMKSLLSRTFLSFYKAPLFKTEKT